MLLLKLYFGAPHASNVAQALMHQMSFAASGALLCSLQQSCQAVCFCSVTIKHLLFSLVTIKHLLFSLVTVVQLRFCVWSSLGFATTCPTDGISTFSCCPVCVYRSRPGGETYRHHRWHAWHSCCHCSAMKIVVAFILPDHSNKRLCASGTCDGSVGNVSSLRRRQSGGLKCRQYCSPNGSSPSI